MTMDDSIIRRHNPRQLSLQDALKDPLFVSELAHDLKNATTVLRSFLEHLENHHTDPAFRERFSELGSREVEKIRTIAHDLILMSRPAFAERAKTDLCEIVREVTAVFSDDFKTSSVECDNLLGSAEISITVDRDQIKQAIMNVVSNSYEAIASCGGRIVIAAAEKRTAWELNISDNGSGIPAQALKVINGLESNHERRGGSGAGLIVTQMIMKKNQGNLAIQTELGKGTNVTLIIPKE